MDSIRWERTSISVSNWSRKIRACAASEASATAPDSHVSINAASLAVAARSMSNGTKSRMRPLVKWAAASSTAVPTASRDAVGNFVSSRVVTCEIWRASSAEFILRIVLAQVLPRQSSTGPSASIQHRRSVTNASPGKKLHPLLASLSVGVSSLVHTGESVLTFATSRTARHLRETSQPAGLTRKSGASDGTSRPQLTGGDAHRRQLRGFHQP